MWDERQWLACEETSKAFGFVRGRLSPRQVRLFFVAMAHRVWDRLPGDEFRDAIEVVDQVADGHRDEAELRALHEHFSAADATAGPDISRRAHALELLRNVTGELRRSCFWVSRAALDLTMRSRNDWVRRADEEKAQVAILRDIVGDPFHPVLPNPAWCTSTVTALAHGIYAERAFDRLPILADALQDAGCEDPRVLDHCRRPAADEHVCGCWVVDMLLNHEPPLTADEWDTTTDAGRMIRTAWPRTTHRKLALAVCGCARRQQLLTFVDIAERDLEGQPLSTEDQGWLTNGCDGDGSATDDGVLMTYPSFIRLEHPANLIQTAVELPNSDYYLPYENWPPVVRELDREAPARAMRCVIGNPLRPPVKFPKKWKTAA
ncbi:MAG TPA: hypothetical protein VGE74_07720, partial [Gemmata sp.]